MQDLNWGVIGFGAFADVAMGPAIVSTEGHNLIAVMGRSRARAGEYARKYGAKRVYDSALDLVKDPEIEAVYVATPNFQHCTHTVMAAERGLHVLCEKPMAVTVEEGVRMVGACHEKDVKLMVGNMMRFNPCHPWLKERLQSGILGDIAEIHTVFEYFLTPEYSQWRVDAEAGGAGAFMDVGVHCVDLMRFLLGSEVTEISAFMETGTYPFPVDLQSVALLRFASGALGTLYVSFNNKNPVNTLDVRGSLGAAICEGTLWRESTGKVTVYREGETRTFEPETGTPNPYVLQIEHFRKCIREDSTPLVSGREGLKDLEVCAGAYLSARTGATVKIS